MPTYEYKCLKCRKRFDQFQRITDPPLSKCEFCGGKAERQISTGVGLIFKGTGFYITDYKNKKTDDTRPKKPDGEPAKNQRKKLEK